MQITMCLSPLGPPTPAHTGRKPRPADHFCMPHRGKTHLAQLPPHLQEPPGLGTEPSCQPWRPAAASARARHLAPTINTMLRCHFPRMPSPQMGETGHQCTLLFTRSLSFHQIILRGQGGARTQTPGGKTWLCGDCGMQMTEQGSQNMWNHTHSPLEIHIHLFISQISVGNLPVPWAALPWRRGREAEVNSA